MNTDVEIRRLTDIDALVRWRMEVLRCVFADADSPDWDALEEAGREYYSRHNLPDDNVTVIASVNGIDEGCGALCMQEEMPSPDNPSGRCAYLMSIYVRDAFRRRGIGGSIVNRLINEARDRLAGKIYLETSSMGEPLYLHAGFEPMEGMLKLKH